MIQIKSKVDRKGLSRALAPAAKKNIILFLEKVAANIKRLMRLPKTGRRYGKHRASAPGEAPAIKSKKLIRSIGQPTLKGLQGSLKITAPYATFLEDGTRNMAARPFVKPSVDAIIQEMQKRGVQSQIRRRF